MTVGRRGVVLGKGGGEPGQRPGSVASGLGEREREREGGKDSESVPPPV